MTDNPLAQVKPGAVASVMPTLEASRFRWMCIRVTESNDHLPSEEEEAAFRREVEAALVPITVDDLQVAIGRLVASFPQRRQSDDRGLILAYAEFLAEYPADVVDAARRHVVRTCKFLPSVAELVEVAEEEVARRRMALASLRVVATERERRHKAKIRDEYDRTRQASEIVLSRLAKERVIAAVQEADPEFNPLPDHWTMGLPRQWVPCLRDSAVHDVKREWGFPGCEDHDLLPEAVAGYLSWCNPVVLGDDWPPAEAAE